MSIHSRQNSELRIGYTFLLLSLNAAVRLVLAHANVIILQFVRDKIKEFCLSTLVSLRVSRYIDRG